MRGGALLGSGQGVGEEGGMRPPAPCQVVKPCSGGEHALTGADVLAEVVDFPHREGADGF